ncbi:MAG: hypothetical protein U0R76_14340 [Candidatus Nanopelagicales bacterium]
MLAWSCRVTVGKGLRRRSSSCLHRAEVGVGGGLHVDRGVELARADRHQRGHRRDPALVGAGLLVDRPHDELPGAVHEGAGDGVADLRAHRRRGLVVDGDVAEGEVGQRAGDHREVDDLGELAGLDAGEGRLVVLHLDRHLADVGDHRGARGVAHRVVDVGGEGLELRAEDDVVGADRGVDDVGHRRLRRRRDHADRRHQREADGQRARGRRGAARVAAAVLAGQPADRAAREGQPEHPEDAAADHRRERDDRDEGAQRGDPDQLRRARAVVGGRQPALRGDDREGEQHGTDHRAHQQRARRQLDLVAHGRHRRYDGGTTGRDVRRDHRDRDADQDRHDDRARLDHERTARQLRAERADQRAQPQRHEDPADHAEHRGHQAEDRRLGEH